MTRREGSPPGRHPGSDLRQVFEGFVGGQRVDALAEHAADVVAEVMDVDGAIYEPEHAVVRVSDLQVCVPALGWVGPEGSEDVPERQWWGPVGN